MGYGVERPKLGFVLSLGAGNVSGLFGVGGGAFKVPIMNLLMGVPLKATVATSNLMIGVTAATGAAIFYGRGYLDPYYAVPAVLGILVGAGSGRGSPCGCGVRRLPWSSRSSVGVRGAHGAQGGGGGHVSGRGRSFAEAAASPRS